VDESSILTLEVFDPPKPTVSSKPILSAALKAKAAAEERHQSTDAADNPKLKSVSPEPVEPVKRPTAMTAELVRKNSLDKSRSTLRSPKKSPRKMPTGSMPGLKKDAAAASPKSKKTGKSSKLTKTDAAKDSKADTATGGGGLLSRLGRKSQH